MTRTAIESFNYVRDSFPHPLFSLSLAELFSVHSCQFFPCSSG